MKLTLFPTRTGTYKTNEPIEIAWERLIRRTHLSYNLVSIPTDKSFIGEVQSSSFRIISSVMGYGALCMLKGQMEEGVLRVNVSIHPVFKVLLGILMIGPVVATIVGIWIGSPDNSIGILLSGFIFSVIVRFAYVELLFRRFARRSLQRLIDVMDLEEL